MGALALYAKEPGHKARVLLATKPGPWNPVPYAKLGKGLYLATIQKQRRFVAVPTEATKPELERAAQGMLQMAALSSGFTADPAKWFEDHDLPFDRVIKIGDWDVAVTTPEYVGRLAIYHPHETESLHGLGLHNANAAIMVMTDEAKRKLAASMVQPLRIRRDYDKRGFIVEPRS